MLVALALVLGVAIFLFFSSFFTDALPDYALNIAAAFLGSVITIIVTAVLLQAQSASELNKEKSIGVFNSKVQMYGDFLEFLNRITIDGEIDDKELLEFRSWAFRLSLVAGSVATMMISLFVMQLVVARHYRWSCVTEENRERWLEWYSEAYPGVTVEIVEGFNLEWTTVGDVVMMLRADLGEEGASEDQEVETTRDLIQDMIVHI